MTFNGVSNTLQNFSFMGATDFEVAGGPADPPPLVKGVGTKRLGKGRVKTLWKQGFEGDFLSWQTSLAYSLQIFVDNFSLLSPLQRVLASWLKIFN